MHKSQRIITLVRLLEDGKPRSIVKLSQELDRTERTIWRDIAELKELNFPVVVEQGSCRMSKKAAKLAQKTAQRTGRYLVRS